MPQDRTTPGSAQDKLARANIAGIKLCQSYRRQYRSNFISAMPTDLYGPNDNFAITLADVLAQLHLHAAVEIRPSVHDYGETLRAARERFERDYVAAVLARCRGRIPDAAKALGIQRTNLYRKMRSLHVPRRGPSASGNMS